MLEAVWFKNIVKRYEKRRQEQNKRAIEDL
jgi:hypothetical protein